MLPPEYIDRMKAFLDQDFASFIASYEQAPWQGLRVNTLKISPEAFTQITPYPLTLVPWTAAGFTLPDEYRPGVHPYHAAGLYYLQDPSAMAVTELLDPQPGERILDLAAAPGGKTTHIASRMRQEGLLVANDIHPSRVKDLYNNIERWGARNTIVLNESPGRLADHFGPFFDRVLVDAPCSGEGMFRKDPAAVYEWSPRMVERCAIRQDQILVDAARLVRPGGRLVYATCTFSPEEDEGSVLRFLEAHPEFEIEVVERRDGYSTGRPEWLSATGNPSANIDPMLLRHAVRLWPHLAPGEGHFIAVMSKKEATQTAPPTFSKSIQLAPPTGEDMGYVERFYSETLKCDLPQDSLSTYGSFLYQITPGMPDLHGLRVIHWGWWLGTFKTRRFEPSQALVMALTPKDLQQVVDFRVDESRLGRYRRGEVIKDSGEDAWVMVAVDGYPLGWAKRVQDRLKPRFPQWLRVIGAWR